MEYTYLKHDTPEWDYFVAAVLIAHEEDKDIRILTGSDAKARYFKIKVGQGMWSLPIRETEIDNYRG